MADTLPAPAALDPPQPPGEGPSIPRWAESLLLQLTSTGLILLAGSELFATAVAALVAGARLTVAAPFERARFSAGILVGLCFELAMWRSGAIVYRSQALFSVPLWIVLLWGFAGLLVATLAAPRATAPPNLYRRGLSLLPLGVALLDPASWPVAIGAWLLALFVSGFYPPLPCGEQGAPSFSLRGLLTTVIIGVGGVFASTSFGLAGVCDFPQAIYAIPPWGLSLWPAFLLSLLGLAR